MPPEGVEFKGAATEGVDGNGTTAVDRLAVVIRATEEEEVVVVEVVGAFPTVVAVVVVVVVVVDVVVVRCVVQAGCFLVSLFVPGSRRPWHGQSCIGDVSAHCSTRTLWSSPPHAPRPTAVQSLHVYVYAGCGCGQPTSPPLRSTKCQSPLPKRPQHLRMVLPEGGTKS